MTVSQVTPLRIATLYAGSKEKRKRENMTARNPTAARCHGGYTVLLLAVTALVGSCGKGQDEVVRDCVKAQVAGERARVKREKKPPGTGIDWMKVGSPNKTEPELEADAYQTCLRAASGK